MTYSKDSVLCLPANQWPKRDQQLWAAVTTKPSGHFQSASVAAGWSPRRCRIVEQAFGQWLAWLAANNLLDPDAPPEDRVSPARIARFVTELVDRVAPVSVAMMVGALHRMLAVLSPETDWTWLGHLVQDLKGWAKPSRDKRLAVVPAKDLFDLGIELMVMAEQLSSIIFAATQYRDGLMIAMLAARPLRIRNFSVIELGRHLVHDTGGYWLRFQPDETKTGVEIDVPVPPELSVWIDGYLNNHWPVLVANSKKKHPKSRAMWMSLRGTPMGEAAVRLQIKTRTKAAFGHAVWPHLFRDCAATSMAVEDPDNVRLAAGLLGHNTFATTEKHYILAQTLQSGRIYQRAIQNLRDAITSLGGDPDADDMYDDDGEGDIEQ